MATHTKLFDGGIKECFSISEVNSLSLCHLIGNFHHFGGLATVQVCLLTYWQFCVFFRLKDRKRNTQHSSLYGN